MGIKTAIEYCDSTINPIMGCTGCELYNSDASKNHCYAATLINRYAGRKGWPRRFNQPELFPTRLEKAIKWGDLTSKQRPDKPWLDGLPRIIFVNDLSDGFCPDVDSAEWLAPHLPKMAASPHIFLLLTKWPHRMRAFCADHPLPYNVWPGVSVLQQKDLWRIDQLLEISATRYWLSIEPLLGVIDLRPWIGGSDGTADGRTDDTHCVRCGEVWGEGHECPPGFGLRPNWVIIGGESGPGARPMQPGWARSLRDQCQVAGTAYFFKQWGRWAPYIESSFVGEVSGEKVLPTGAFGEFGDGTTGIGMSPVGKKRAGHLLDGQEWREFPG